MFNFIFFNKKNLFLLLGLTLVIVILALISMLSPKVNETKNGIIPVPLASKPSGFILPPASPPSSQTPAPYIIPYDLKSFKKDFERITSPEPLIQSDLEIRNSLINQLNNQSGILVKTGEYQIEYVKAPDSFMVELNSIDPASAKLVATDWFKQQGLSVQGICNMPVVFYLSDQARNYLIQTGQKFNPIPEGCK